MKIPTLAVSCLASLAVAPTALAQMQLPNLSSPLTRQMLLVGESRGVKVYIDPSKIRRRLPFVRFWVYAVLPPSPSRRISSLDTLMGIDCTSAVSDIRDHSL